MFPVIDRKRDVRRSEPMTYSEREFGASQSDYEPKEQKMSDDIVERLNRFKTLLIKSDASKPEGVAVAMLAEAANEIERLRAGRAAVVEECAQEVETFDNESNVGKPSLVKNIAHFVRALKGGAA
jgi:hypothetical protein